MTSYSIAPTCIRNLRIGNAAGTIKTVEDVDRACRSEALTDVTVGSVTVEERAGNIGTTYAFDPATGVSVNALGLPNKGLTWYLKHLRHMRKRTQESKKRLRVSIAGFSPEEYGLLAERIRYAGADELEINLGCPNVWSADGKQKPIVSYDPTSVSRVLGLVRQRIGMSIPIAVKISPVPDDILPSLCDAIVSSGIVTHVAGVNTVPNQRLMIDGKSALRFRSHDAPDDAVWNDVGGGAGTLVAEDCKRVIRYLDNHLPANIKSIAAGGISDGTHAAEIVVAGACGFQCATAYIEGGGPHAMNRILEEFSSFVPR
jgi:dihydroorotate dehydrogenase (fumarate)